MKKEYSKAQNIKGDIWKIPANSNLYLIKGEIPILIETGDRAYCDQVRAALSEIIDIDTIQVVLLTHLHYDHIGNIDLFSDAKIYTSKKEIEGFQKDGFGAVLNGSILGIIKDRKILPFDQKRINNMLRMIETPGHTAGSVCYIYDRQKVIFTGDTFFRKGLFGRTDLPTSAPAKMEHSLRRLAEYKQYLICPGHDY